MDISLPPEMERRIAEKVESGLYENASEVVRESLRLLFTTDERGSRLRDEIDSAIQVGLDQLDRGEGLNGPASRSRLLARFGPGAS